jgi:hypothetical protein
MYGEVALLSVLPQWRAMQHYNVRALVDERARRGSPVETTSGGGYP